MSRWKVFALGALGGSLPILVSLASADLAAFFDHFSTLTTGNILGYCLKSIVLIVLGGTLAALNSEVTQPMSLVQLGIAAPALITSAINGSPAVASRPILSLHVIEQAYADQGSTRPFVVAGGFFSDLVAGAIRPPSSIQLDNLHKDIGSAIDKSPSTSNGGASNQLTIPVFPGQRASPSSAAAGFYCLTNAGLFGPGPATVENQTCIVRTDGNAYLGHTVSQSANR